MKPFIALICVVLVNWAAFAADDKPAIKLSNAEQKILDSTNQERAAAKLPPLKPNATLMKVARAHAANMANQGKMEHELDRKNPGDRIRDAGYVFSWYAENIAAGGGWSLDAVMQTWMESEGHRANILSDKVDEIGIGIVSDGKATTYYAQVFGRQDKR